MFPVLLTIGKFAISSYGVFLAVGFLSGIFLVWRLSRAWELDEEKTLDLTLLTVIGGVIGARLIFVIQNLNYFLDAPMSAFLVYKFPGFSFWGGLAGGFCTLFLFSRGKKKNFWQIVDIASVGFFAALIFSELGCFAGGCNVGIPSKAFFAVPMIGFLGKRWPVQLIGALMFFIGFLNVWHHATHFHPKGKILSLSIIYIGIIKLLLEPLKQGRSEWVLWLVLTLAGAGFYYKVTKQNPVLQFKQFRKNFTLQNFVKTCYNQKANFFWQIRNFKKILRRFNVKFTKKNT